MKVTEDGVHEAAEHLGEPVIDAGEHAEDGGDAHHEMEMRDDEIGIVEMDVDRGIAQVDTREAARDEQAYEPDRKEHSGGEADIAAPEGCDPVENLDGRRNGDHHGEEHEDRAEGGSGLRRTYDGPKP